MGRTSIRTPAKSGFQQTVSGEVFGQGDRGSLTLANPGSWLGHKSLRPKREELLKGYRIRFVTDFPPGWSNA
jgi:hypothetical protein